MCVSKKSESAKVFDEVAYREALIKGGVSPDSAAEVARKTTAARTESLARTPDLFPPAAEEDRTEKAHPVDPGARAPGAEASSVKPLSRNQSALVDASAEIMGQSPTGDDFAFVHAVMCQVGLPRSQVEGREFMRQSGSAWVNVQAGFLDEGFGPVSQPIPYGAMPRLALAWITTYAKRHSTREIPIGDSAAEFLRIVGISGGDGRRYATLRKQMNALAACRLQLGYRGRTFNGQPVEQFDAWTSNKDAHQKALWPGVMLLSDSFHRELVESAVPLDNRALHALKGSALALDIYAWLAHRLHRIDGRPVVLYWANLREQFGQEYQGKNAAKDFKAKFLQALEAVKMVYPKAQVKQVTGGLLLLPSPPPIPYKT